MGILAATSVAAAAEQAVAAETVTNEIASFDRLWLPKPEDLAGLSVSITTPPAQPSQAGSPERIAADMTVLTAEYTRQLLRKAGAGQGRRAADHAHPVSLHILYGADERNRAYGRSSTIDSSALYAWQVVDHYVQKDSPFTPQEGPAERRLHAGADGSCTVGFRVEETMRSLSEVARRKLARSNAARIIRGLTDYHRLTRDAASVPPDEGKVQLRGLVRAIWPEGDLPPERADWFCRMFARVAITNPSLVYFKPEAMVDGETIILRGATNVPAIVDGLTAALHSAGLPKVRSEMRALPDLTRLGGQRFGACVVSSVITRNEPDEATVEQTELFYGEPLFLLDRVEGYYLLHAGDGYWGWAPQAAIMPLSDAAYRAYVAHDRAVALEDLELGTVRIPRSASVAVEPAPEPGKFAVILPDGNRADADADALRLVGAAQQIDAEDRVRAALALLYTPYKFGGRSPLGLDCSGLINAVCARSGHRPARDAAQLVDSGTLTATRWFRDGLRAGDMVYFIDPRGKVYHAGIAIDPTHIVDAAPPAVQIGCIVPGDRLYDARMDRDFFMAKRP